MKPILMSNDHCGLLGIRLGCLYRYLVYSGNLEVDGYMLDNLGTMNAEEMITLIVKANKRTRITMRPDGSIIVVDSESSAVIFVEKTCAHFAKAIYRLDFDKSKKREKAKATVDVNTTVTGAGGDFKVGNMGVRMWADFRASNVPGEETDGKSVQDRMRGERDIYAPMAYDKFRHPFVRDTPQIGALCSTCADEIGIELVVGDVPELDQLLVHCDESLETYPSNPVTIGIVRWARYLRDELLAGRPGNLASLEHSAVERALGRSKKAREGKAAAQEARKLEIESWVSVNGPALSQARGMFLRVLEGRTQ